MLCSPASQSYVQLLRVPLMQAQIGSVCHPLVHCCEGVSTAGSQWRSVPMLLPSAEGECLLQARSSTPCGAWAARAARTRPWSPCLPTRPASACRGCTTPMAACSWQPGLQSCWSTSHRSVSDLVLPFPVPDNDLLLVHPQQGPAQMHLERPCTQQTYKQHKSSTETDPTGHMAP